jgi:hypothetical protein
MEGTTTTFIGKMMLLIEVDKINNNHHDNKMMRNQGKSDGSVGSDG